MLILVLCNAIAEYGTYDLSLEPFLKMVNSAFLKMFPLEKVIIA
jgi:hypothetical protein